jgi:hypothetical protein
LARASWQRWCYCNSISAYYHGGLHIHPDHLQIGIFELLEEGGCHYILASPVTGAILEGDRIAGVVAAGKSGKREYRGRVIIDCTGDADVAWPAGAPRPSERAAGRTGPNLPALARTAVQAARRGGVLTSACASAYSVARPDGRRRRPAGRPSARDPANWRGGG